MQSPLMAPFTSCILSKTWACSFLNEFFPHLKKLTWLKPFSGCKNTCCKCCEKECKCEPGKCTAACQECKEKCTPAEEKKCPAVHGEHEHHGKCPVSGKEEEKCCGWWIWIENILNYFFREEVNCETVNPSDDGNEEHSNYFHIHYPTVLSNKYIFRHFNFNSQSTVDCWDHNYWPELAKQG